MCCRQQVGLIYLSEEKYNVGGCAPIKYHAIWNPEVEEIVYSSNGYKLKLSHDAVSKIKSKYTGTPLFVNFKIKQKCDCKKLCGPCCAGCSCDCTPHIFSGIYTTEIAFANKDVDSKCPAFCNMFCCVNLANGCMYKRVWIDAKDAEFVWDRKMTKD